MKKLLSFAFLLMFGFIIKAQTFEKSIYSSFFDIGIDAIKTLNGDYITTGYSTINGAGVSDFVLIKIDVNGNVIWQKVFGETGEDKAVGLIETADNNYLMVGLTNSFGNTSGGIFLYKFNSSGTKIWSKFFESTSAFPNLSKLEPTSIQLLIDGGFLISGYHKEIQSAMLLRTDSLGNMTFGKTYTYANPFSLIGQDRANRVIVASDQNYIVTGYTHVGSNFPGMLLMKVNQQGDTLWCKNYGGIQQWDIGNDVIETQDFGFLITGITYSFGQGQGDVIVTKTDFNGNVQWTRVFGGLGKDEGKKLIELPSGNFLILGYSESFTSSGSPRNMYVIKLDKNGNHIFSKIIDGGIQQGDELASAKLYNNEILLAGSVNATFDDMYVGVTDTNFITLCHQTTITDSISFVSISESNQSFDLGLVNSNFTPLDVEFNLQFSDSTFCAIPTTVFNKSNMDKSISVFPNPTNDYLIINSSTTISSIEIIDFSGKLIYSKRIENNNKMKINTQNFINGIYFVRIIDNFNQITNRKISIIK